LLHLFDKGFHTSVFLFANISLYLLLGVKKT